MGISPQTDPCPFSKLIVPVGKPHKPQIMKRQAQSSIQTTKRSAKQRLTLLAILALYLVSPFLTNLSLQQAFAAESIPVPTSQRVGNAADEEALLSIGASNTERTVPLSPYDHPGMSLIEQETQTRNSMASQEVNRNLNNEFANYNETYTGLNQFWNDTIIGKFFNNFLPWIGKNVSEFIYGWIPSAVSYLSRALEIFVLNPNIAVNGLANDPRFTISNTPAAREGQSYINAIAPEVRKLADIMYGIAVDLLLLLFVLCIWKFWADASWGRGGSNIMGAVGRLITTSALLLAWPTIYAFWIQISNEMIKAIYFNSAGEMVAFDQAMATVIKGGLLAIGGLLLNALAPVAGAALGGLAGGPIGGLVGGTIGGFVAFAGLIIFLIFGGILIAQLVYLVTLKSIQTILLTAQYMFAPIFIVMFATPDTEDSCAGFIKSFVEVSLWSFVWVGFLRLLVIILTSDFSPWGKVVLGLGILQLMISVPAFIARAQISPMSDFLSAGMVTGGLVNGAKAIASTGQTFALAWADHRNKSHTVGGAQGAQKTATSQLNPANNGVRNQAKFNASINPTGAPTPGGPTPPILPGLPGGPPLTPPGGPGAAATTKAGLKSSTSAAAISAATTKPTGKPTGTTPPGATLTGAGATGATATGATATGADADADATGTDATATPGAGATAKDATGTTAIPGSPDASKATKPGGEKATVVPGATKAADPTAAGKKTPASLKKHLDAGSTPPVTDTFKQLLGSEAVGDTDGAPPLANFGGPMHARNWVNNFGRLLGGYLHTNKGTPGKEGPHEVVGSVGGSTGVVGIGADQNGLINQQQAAKVVAAGAMGGELAKNHENFADASRRAAAKAGYDRPQGALNRMASGIMYGLAGKHWGNSASAKQAFQQGMYKEATKGAMAYLEGQPGNEFTDEMNRVLGPCSDDMEVEIVSSIMNPTSFNSGMNPSAIPGRQTIVQTGGGLGTYTIPASGILRDTGIRVTDQKTAYNSIGNYLEGCAIRKGVDSPSHPGRGTFVSSTAKSITRFQAQGINAIGSKFGPESCKNVEQVMAVVEIVEAGTGGDARDTDFQLIWEAVSNSSSVTPATAPVNVGKGHDNMPTGIEGQMHQRLGMRPDRIAEVQTENFGAGMQEILTKMVSAGVKPEVARLPEAIKTATQVDFSVPSQAAAFASAANATGKNVNLQRVYITENMMLSDPENYEAGRITANDIYINEAVAHIQSNSNSEAYRTHFSNPSNAEFCKEAVFLNSRYARALSGEQGYRPSSKFDREYSDKEVKAALTGKPGDYKPRASGPSGGGGSGRREDESDSATLLA